MTGIFALAAALLLSVLVALAMRWKNGRFSTRSGSREVLTREQIGANLGERATLVQFSSSFCSPCRATRVLLADIATSSVGVVAVEIDAETSLDLVRDLDIMRTPTVLILDDAGAVVTRASGLPRREQVMSALASAARGAQ